MIKRGYSPPGVVQLKNVSYRPEFGKLTSGHFEKRAAQCCKIKLSDGLVPEDGLPICKKNQYQIIFPICAVFCVPSLQKYGNMLSWIYQKVLCEVFYSS
jgi:hypothetical protein